MREITKRLLQMSNKWGYEGREEERQSIIKEHLTNYLEDVDLTLQDIADDPSLIHEHYIYQDWMPYTSDIYLFFDLDILDAVNQALTEWGPFGDHEAYITEINWLLIIDTYSDNCIYENINQWAEEELERAATNETR